MEQLQPLELVLEFARAAAGGDPHGFRFVPQDYLLRGAGGGFENANFAWDQALLADLQAVSRPGRDPALIQRLGELLRRFLTPAGWPQHEERVLEAIRQDRHVLLTFRSAAAELYALPWELLTLKATGQHIGELPTLLLRYEWPDTKTAAEQPDPRPEGGRILLGWSAAGGAVPAAEHLQAIQRACQAGFHPFDPACDVLPQASAGRLAAVLEAARAKGAPIAVLHLLCHGSAVGSTFGLALSGEDDGDAAVVVDAGRLRQLLAPHAATLRLVVLAACDSGNSGQLGNHLGSIAQTLHRAGIQAVVASRFPLSVRGSIRLAEELYQRLLVDPASLESALLATRMHLGRDAAQLDWASLQLYARAADGPDTRPVIFRPFQGLLAFQPEHHRFLFGRDCEIAEVLGELQALAKAGQPRLLVVAGASGTGKSSVVLGGVVPRLLAMPGAAWQFLSVRPGSEPLATLEAVLAQSAASSGPALLVVDQFEELFTHIQDAGVRQAFVRRLWQLAGQAGSGLSVLITLRVDFIGRCGELVLDEHGQRLDSVAYDEAHRIFIAHMSPPQLRSLIEEPARKVGLKVEAGLVGHMLQDVGSEPGALPLLEDTLDLLWQHRRRGMLTQKSYAEVGGVIGALQQRADALIDWLDTDAQRVARRLLVRLVSTGTELATRRRVLIDKLRPVNPAEAASFDRVLVALVEARLLVCGGQGPTQLVEVAHESLIRKWPRLLGWVQEDRTMLAELEKVDGWVAQWKELGTLLSGNQLGYTAEVEKRYQEDFPQDARALLTASQAVEEQERRRIQRGRRSAQLVAAFFAVAAVVLAALGAWAWRERQRALLANRETEIQRREAEARRQEAQQRLARSYFEQGRALFLQHDPSRAIVYLAEAYKEGEDSAVLRMLLALATQALEPQVVLSDSGSDARQVEFSPDGTQILSSSDKTVHLWDSRSSQLLARLQVPENREYRFRQVCFNPKDGRVVLFEHNSVGGLQARDVTTGKSLFSLSTTMAPSKLWFVRGGEQVIVTGLQGEDERHVTEVWERNGKRPLRVIKEWAQAVSRDGSLLVSLKAEGPETTSVWDLRSGRRLLQREASFSEVVFSPDNSHFAAADGHVLRLYELSGDTISKNFFGHTGEITAVDFSPEGRRLLTASQDRTARIWDIKEEGAGSVLQGHTNQVRDARFSPDGGLVVTASDDRTLRIWNLSKGQPRAVLQIPKTATVRFSPDSTQVISSERNQSRVFATQSGQFIKAMTDDRLEGVRRKAGLEARQLTLSPDGRYALSVLGKKPEPARIWDLATGSSVALQVSGSISSPAFSADGKRLLVVLGDESAQVFDTVSGRSLSPLMKGHTQGIADADLSSDGRRAVTASRDRTVRVWDAERGALLHVLEHERAGEGVSAFFTLDSALVVTDHHKVWDAVTGSPVAVLDFGSVRPPLAFSPDGRTLLTGRALWNVPRVARSPDKLAAFIRCRVLYRLEQGGLIPALPEPAACLSLRK